MERGQRTNTFALASLVLGALGWVVAPLIGSLSAVITGHIALRQIRTWGGEEGTGIAYAGLALGYANLVGFALLVIALLWMVGLLGGAATFMAGLGG